MKKLTFQVLEGVDKGRIFRELTVPITLGREEGNHLRLNDERISRFHAKVQLEDGDVIITDLDSTNGTRVNGVTIQIRRLRPGDHIGIGRSTLRLGTLEEINQYRKKMAVNPQKVKENLEPTIAGSIAGDDDDFDFGTIDETDQVEWGQSEREMPPLPMKLSPSQSARLCEIFDYLHQGLSQAVMHIDADQEALPSVKIPFADWQKLQTLQMFLARYNRSVADPEHQPD